VTYPRLINTAHKSEADFNKDNLDYQNRAVLSTAEVDGMIDRVNIVQIAPFYRLRAKCLVSLLHKFGKRRCELLRLKRKDIVENGNNLEFTFSLAKKRKRGFFQYLAYLENLIKKGQAFPDVLDKRARVKLKWGKRNK
jgi:integrase